MFPYLLIRDDQKFNEFRLEENSILLLDFKACFVAVNKVTGYPYASF